MEIKRLINPDSETISYVAKIHYSVLTESFLNNFGLEFLEIIYENLARSKNSILLVSSENTNVMGYLLAVTNYSKFFKIATSGKKMQLVIIILKTLVKKPNLAYKLISYIFNVSEEDFHAELQFIAILPKYQGQGLGTKLIEQLKTELSLLNIKKYFVGTKASDELSNRFYQKMRFTKVYIKTYFGAELNYYLSPEI